MADASLARPVVITIVCASSFQGTMTGTENV